MAEVAACVCDAPVATAGAGGAAAREAGEGSAVAASPPRTIKRHVEIPMTVLTAADCDPEFRDPPPRDASLAERQLEIRVPSGSSPGCKFLLDLQKDEPLQIRMPEFAKEGDVLCIRQRSDGSWRVGRKATTFSFVLPDCAAGDALKLPGPDGRVLSFAVPEGLAPGYLVILKRDGDGPWSFDTAEELPAFAETPPIVESIAGPYVGILQVLKSRDYLRKLPLDEHGVLQVSIPFCGRLHEYSVLTNFLSEHCLSLEGVAGISIFATEVLDGYARDWAVADRWCRRMHPRIRFKACLHDLSADPLPEAGLVVGIHPEVTKGGRWFQIIGSILQSSRGGLCIFATFFEFEMKTVLNMVDMYKEAGATVEVVENPHYAAQEPPNLPPMRYLILVLSSRLV